MEQNSKNSIKIANLLLDKYVDKETITHKLNISHSTFFNNIVLLKKAGFKIKRKQNEYIIFNFKEIFKLTDSEKLIFSYLLSISDLTLSKSKTNSIFDLADKVLYLSDKKTYDEVIEKYELLKNEFNKKLTAKTQKKPKKNRVDIETPASNKKYETTFELYGRLAKTYLLKEDETIIEKTKDKIVVVNNSSNKKILFQRLLRYDILCKIVSPKRDVAEFKKLINKSIENIGI